ncbi:hypothetical protein [Levilactobacillus suantsaii]|uniref:hypothetical protein n=1 Tax=Levilactobacillus suantsaii TaxID=2292255 RepID=UPI0014834012|nr:hypothetical protein [Levilactobacillus suantsaii]QMU08745.1 hypothetical protein H3M12_03535 [Levilactobacillus suantsaii]
MAALYTDSARQVKPHKVSRKLATNLAGNCKSLHVNFQFWLLMGGGFIISHILARYLPV